MGRVLHGHVLVLLMIVDQIHIRGMHAVEAEDNAPVSSGGCLLNNWSSQLKSEDLSHILIFNPVSLFLNRPILTGMMDVQDFYDVHF